MNSQKCLLSDKLERIPELEEYVIEQNAVIADFLESREAVTKSGDIEISNPHDFFSDLSAAMNKMSSEFTYSSDSLRTKLYVQFGRIVNTAFPSIGLSP